MVKQALDYIGKDHAKNVCKHLAPLHEQLSSLPSLEALIPSIRGLQVVPEDSWLLKRLDSIAAAGTRMALNKAVKAGEDQAGESDEDEGWLLSHQQRRCDQERKKELRKMRQQKHLLPCGFSTRQ